MPQVDLIDETFLAAEPRRVRALLCDEARWHTWFPDLELMCFDDRVARGKRWTVGGALVGTAEVWLEVCGDGTIAHVFVQADPAVQAHSPGRKRRPGRAARALHRRYVVPLKRHVTAAKDEVEDGRPPGEPVAPAGDDAAPKRHRP